MSRILEVKRPVWAYQGRDQGSVAHCHNLKAILPYYAYSMSTQVSGDPLSEMHSDRALYLSNCNKPLLTNFNYHNVW